MMSAFDRTQLLSLIDQDQKLLKELLQLYTQEWPPLIQELKESMEPFNGNQVSVLAHRLHGMVRNFFAQHATELASSLEEKAKHKIINKKRLMEDLLKLENELVILEQELKSFLLKMGAS